MVYNITKYSYDKAKKLGVKIKLSKNKTKKIDVFRNDKSNSKNNRKIVSIGANGMNDYPTYIKKYGLKYAKERRRLYKIRHEKDRHSKGSAGYYADKILW